MSLRDRAIFAAVLVAVLAVVGLTWWTALEFIFWYVRMRLGL